MLAETQVILDPGEKREDNTANMWGALPQNAASLQVRAGSGEECLIGYIMFYNPSQGSEGRALISLRGGPGGENLVIPHVASNKNWWTGIAVMNTTDIATNLRVSAYGEDGESIDETAFPLPGYGNLVKCARDLFPLILPDDIAAIRMKADAGANLSGLIVFDRPGQRQLAGMPVHPAEEGVLYLPGVAQSTDWWTGFGVMNAGENQDEIVITAFDGSDEPVSEIIYPVRSNQRIALTVEDVLGAALSENIAYLKFESRNHQPLSGLYLIGSSDNCRLMGDVLVADH